MRLPNVSSASPMSGPIGGITKQTSYCKLASLFGDSAPRRQNRMEHLGLTYRGLKLKKQNRMEHLGLTYRGLKLRKKNQMEHLGLTYRGLVDRHGMRSLEIPTGETDSPLPNILENVTLASDQHQIGWGHHNPE